MRWVVTLLAPLARPGLEATPNTAPHLHYSPAQVSLQHCTIAPPPGPGPARSPRVSLHSPVCTAARPAPATRNDGTAGTSFITRVVLLSTPKLLGSSAAVKT